MRVRVIDSGTPGNKQRILLRRGTGCWTPAPDGVAAVVVAGTGWTTPAPDDVAAVVAASTVELDSKRTKERTIVSDIILSWLGDVCAIDFSV